ncbi:MAG: DUF1003 domain-containing protein [bacterium]
MTRHPHRPKAPAPLTEDEKKLLAETEFQRMRHPNVAQVVEHNIDHLLLMRREEDKRRGMQEKVADAITAFSGDIKFLYIHMGWFGLWIAINLGWVPGVPVFDKYPFGLLTMIVSLEAIFLSTLVMISQNRMQRISDERADLDLHINLLTEYEVTRVLKLVDAMSDKLGCDEGKDPELGELEQVINPEEIIKEIEERNPKKK